MSSQSAHSIDFTIPTDLESARAKLVFLYVGASGETTIDQLCTDLGIKKGTALSITGTLRKRGHLERTDGRFELVD
ncbi:MarR family transcriptional regulator [Salinadaptatus halalkaliphilus]|uniref:MarR family transcriptional regulator n=1 Tax=Salinadaptatus halalkaliphilus TaxID=2419781 RepID=A0A4S3TK01_9EURY|nr:helix-turn-helix domain-containing protein [Salinadaptatus halalkaliphilus]THE62908.1 MarR family transcriptional regulator [Salinadaptatus halalkaliphilus]